MTSPTITTPTRPARFRTVLLAVLVALAVAAAGLVGSPGTELEFAL